MLFFAKGYGHGGYGGGYGGYGKLNLRPLQLDLCVWIWIGFHFFSVQVVMAVLEDTGVMEVTGVMEDTAVMEDTVVMEDTGVMEDTVVMEDMVVMEDTAVMEDTVSNLTGYREKNKVCKYSTIIQVQQNPSHACFNKAAFENMSRSYLKQ